MSILTDVINNNIKSEKGKFNDKEKNFLQLILSSFNHSNT